MNDFVARRVREREAQLYQLTQQIKVLQQQRREASAELRAYRDVLAHIGPDKHPEAEQPSLLVPPTVRIRARLGDNWRSILSHVRQAYPLALDISDLRAFVQAENLEVTDDSLRSQLSFYSQRGWLERVGQGKYRITEQGAHAVELPLSENLENKEEEEEEAEDRAS